MYILAPVLGLPSIVIHKPSTSQSVCLSWPQMPYGSHILMHDDGRYTKMADHEGDR